MPLDPTLAAGFAPVKFDNPIEQMGGALTNALMMDKVGNLGDERMRNAMLDQIVGRHTGRDGKVNQAGVLYDLGVAGLGRSVMSQQKSYDESAKTQSETAENTAQAVVHEATALKSRNEAQKLFDEHLATLLTNVSDIGQLHPRIVQAYKNEVAYNLYGGEQGAMAAAANDLAEAQAAIDSGPEGLKNWVTKKVVGKDAYKNNYQVVGEENKQTLGATPEYGTPGFTPIKEFGPKPVSQGTTINMPGAKTYAEKVTELTAENDVAAGKAAAAVPLIVADLDRLDALIDRSFTGRGSEWKESFSAWTGTNQDAVTATQQVKQLLSTDMLKNIGTLRNQYDVKLGSVTEREFAELRNTTPRPSDTPATIKAWVKKAKEIALKTQDDYERLVVNRKNNPITSPVASLLPPLSTAPKAPAPPRVPQPPSAPKAPGAPPTNGTNGKPISKRAADDLIKNPGNAADFDAYFGKGSAAQVLGGASNGGRPLLQ